MNKYLTFAGRQPVFLGDIDFMQNAVRDTFAQLLKGYTGLATPTAILHGLTLAATADSIAWTDGVVCLAGEILPVPAGALTGTSGGPYYLSIVTEYSGEREMGDGVIRPVLQERYAEITETSTDYPIANMTRINPVDVYSPSVYDFSGISNAADYYAKFANCGGALHIALRQPTPAENEPEIFHASVRGLPQTILDKLSYSGNPSSMICSIRLPEATFLSATLAWSVGRGVATFTITVSTPSVSAITAPFEVREVLPIF